MKKTELETYRKQMQEKADAELQAKLAMVRMERKPGYGRAPRKIGEMHCDTGIKRGYAEEKASFTLRLEEKKGEFIAEHGDIWYISKSRDALHAKMSQVARVTLDIKWMRYIHVEYEIQVPCRDSWRNGTSALKVDDKRDKNMAVLGMELKWEIVEYSDEIQLPGDQGGRFMTRDVDEETGEPEQKQESVKELPAGLVPYTKEREELLKSIRAAFGSIDKKMVELLSGTPEQVAKRIDAANGTLLLAAPAAEKKGKR